MLDLDKFGMTYFLISPCIWTKRYLDYKKVTSCMTEIWIEIFIHKCLTPWCARQSRGLIDMFIAGLLQFCLINWLLWEPACALSADNAMQSPESMPCLHWYNYRTFHNTISPT